MKRWHRAGLPLCNRCYLIRWRVSQTTQSVEEIVALQERREFIAGQWRAGVAQKVIATRLNVSPAVVGGLVARMRIQGWDLPYRRIRSQNRKRQ